MAIPLLSDVTETVRVTLGDTQVVGGGLYTDNYLIPYVNKAYQEMFKRLSIGDATRVRREAYFAIAVGQTVLSPASKGLINFGEPNEMWERGSLVSFAVGGVTLATGSDGQSVDVLITANSVGDLTANGLVTGSTYLMQLNGLLGISDDINDEYGVLIVDATHIRLLGCTSTGTWTNPSGTVFYSTESQWNGPIFFADDTDGFSTSPDSQISQFCFQRGVIKFPPVGNVREVKLEYQLSSTLPGSTANPPTTSVGLSMGIDDSLNFLAARASQYAARSKGNMAAAQSCQEEAQYFLGLMISDAARALQSQAAIVPLPFRGKRNIRPFAY